MQTYQSMQIRVVISLLTKLLPSCTARIACTKHICCICFDVMQLNNTIDVQVKHLTTAEGYTQPNLLSNRGKLRKRLRIQFSNESKTGRKS